MRVESGGGSNWVGGRRQKQGLTALLVAGDEGQSSLEGEGRGT